MNINAIRDVATRARRQLMEAVERRCLLYGIEEGAQGGADAVNGRVLSAAERAQRRELLRIQEELRADGKPGTGHAALVEQAAYTWFNRLFAIRFMELNDRLPSHVRMLSAQDGSFAPECLREAMDLPLDALDREEAARLVAEGDDEGLFRLVLLAQCAELAECMPAVFERVGSAMELLLPDGLLAKDGVVESLVTGIPEDDWREGVEIVGWAYQFYMTEVRAELQDVKAGKNQIGTATQIYTPEWIVRYLVDNSIGRLWALNHSDSELIAEMEYYVADDPNYPTTSFLKIDSPEELTVIDPACGSGHILSYSFDLLARMYAKSGYRPRDAARLILEKNLTGIEIDPRAAQLAAFTLTMKACELDGRFLRRGIVPRIVTMRSVVLAEDELLVLEEYIDVTQFEDSSGTLSMLDEVGSLWAPTPEFMSTLEGLQVVAVSGGGLFGSSAAGKVEQLRIMAKPLAKAYAVCIANPPYRNSIKMDPWLSQWLRMNYPEEKSDLFAAFTWRMLGLRQTGGITAIASSNSWMFNSAYEKARLKLLDRVDIATLVQLSVHGYEGIAAQVFAFACQDIQIGKYFGGYIRLYDFDHHSLQGPKTLEAIKNNDCGWFYRKESSNFGKIPGKPFVYWASESVYEAFVSAPKFKDVAKPAAGITSGNNVLFFRLWWEVSSRGINRHAYVIDDITDTAPWCLCNKGGEFRKWYGNTSNVLKFGPNARSEMASFPGFRPVNLNNQLRDSITWSDVTSGDNSFRRNGLHFMFDQAGKSAFPSNEKVDLVLAFLNSSMALSMLRMVSPGLHCNTGDIGKLPVCLPTGEESNRARALSSCNVGLSHVDWDSFETSWGFTAHPLVRTSRISSAYGLWSSECKDRFVTLRQNEEELNRIFAHIYRMDGEVPIEVEDDKVSVRRADLGRDVRSLISYSVGCMFGRYSLDRPGLVLANQGDGLNAFLTQVPYPRYMPDEDGILPITDDEYFEDDIVAMFCDFLKEAYGHETLEENLQFVADALDGTGPARKVIRDYFMNHFFRDHCATYSVMSAGKRPIYWLIDSGKLGGFRALIYMHRYTPDLLARVRTDYVHERQERYRSRIAELEREREGASRREQSAIDKELRRLRAQLDEVTKFEERLHHLADQMIEIDLDDGFKVNYAKFADVMAKVR